jgi:hypothetical protein
MLRHRSAQLSLKNELKSLNSSHSILNTPLQTQGTTNHWKPEFSERREWIDRSFNETKEEVQQKRGILEAFLRDNDTSSPSVAYKVIKEFCQKFSSPRTSQNVLTPVNGARAWLDVRPKASGYSQSRPEWLTAEQLSDVLSQVLYLQFAYSVDKIC